MNSRERVAAALNHEQPDHTPCDYFGTPEIDQALFDYFGVKDVNGVRECLKTDIRYIEIPYTGPELKSFEDGSFEDIWGVIRKPMPNEYGEYAEPVNLPFAKWESVSEAENYSWPSTDDYDYEALAQLCDEFCGKSIAIGRYGIQDFINGVAFGRGVEQVLMDIALEEPVYLYIVEKRHSFFMEHIEKALKAGKGKIDLVLCGDDFGSQKDALISPATFIKLFADKKKEFFDMVHSYGAKISHHSCGSTVKLIPEFIKAGMDCLETIQPQASGMNPFKLKEDFGNEISFHGAVDVQGWLQEAGQDEIREHIGKLMEKVGKGGGFIIGPCHNIQPDTPLDNVITMYETIANSRGTSIR